MRILKYSKLTSYMVMRSPSLHPTSLPQRSPSGHSASYKCSRELINSNAVLCELCEQRVAKYRCKICGRQVCEIHMRIEEGICEVCASALCNICRSALSVRSCISCGRIICLQCSVQIDEVRYVCINCFIKLGRGKLKGKSTKS